MAENIIDKFSYNGNTYKLQDNVSGYITSSDIPAIFETVDTNNGSYTSSDSTDIGIYGVNGIDTRVLNAGIINVGHSNSVTAQNTQAVYPIKIDAQGHISEYGTAVTVPTASTTNPLMDGTASYGSGTSYARSNHVHPSDTSKVNTSGGEITGNITMKGAAASNSPAIIFQRGTLTDNYNDWQIQDRGGYLYFDERGQGSSAFTNRVMFNTTGGIVATTFSGQLSGTISSSTTATTQSAGDNSTKVATTAYVDRAIPDEISDLTNDMVYDLGTITPDSSTGVFSITEAQRNDISTMWNKGFCAIRATVGGTTYWALKENTITYNNINFMGFAGTWAEVSIGIFTGKTVIGISVDSSIGIFGRISDVLLDDVQGLIMTTSINNKQLMPNSNIDLTASDVGAQPTLVSGTNIKTINNESLLGSGNITISSGSSTDVRINGTSITSSGVANIVTNGTYNSSTNKIATMNDLPVLTFTPSGNNLIISQQQVSGITNGNTVSY